MSFQSKEPKGRKRDIPILFYVDKEEKKLIRQKMFLSKTKNMSAYLRKMAIDGMILNVDTTWQKKQFEEMHKIGINMNQLAKVANTVGSASSEDIQELKRMLQELWRILKSSPSNPL